MAAVRCTLLLALICVVSATNSSNNELMTVNNEKIYYLNNTLQANWYQAMQSCHYHGMSMASITSQEENDKLEKLIKDSGADKQAGFWTSGCDKGQEGHYTWMDSGRFVSYSNWYPGEPDNSMFSTGETADCISVGLSKEKLVWYDVYCSHLRYFVCETEGPFQYQM